MQYIDKILANKAEFAVSRQQNASYRVVESAVLMAYVIDTVTVQNLLTLLCCVLEKAMLPHFSLLEDFSKQF